MLTMYNVYAMQIQINVKQNTNTILHMFVLLTHEIVSAALIPYKSDTRKFVIP